MPYLAKIVVFWLAVCGAIWLLKLVPGSLPARIAFVRLGPAPVRGELRCRYLLRWAACAGIWFAQALSVFVACSLVASHSDPTLRESTEFVVFWVVIVPCIGAASGVGALAAVAASLWLRRGGALRRAGRLRTRKMVGGPAHS